MGWKEIEPPPPGSPGFDVPLWLILVLAGMWVWFAQREPKDGKDHHDGWFVPPAIISIVAFVGATWLGLT